MSGNGKSKPITVAEVKAIEPLADVYQFNTYNRYIVMLRKSNLAGGNELVKQKAGILFQLFQAAKIPALIFIGADDDLTIFEIKQ